MNSGKLSSLLELAFGTRPHSFTISRPKQGEILVYSFILTCKRQSCISSCAKKPHVLSQGADVQYLIQRAKHSQWPPSKMLYNVRILWNLAKSQFKYRHKKRNRSVISLRNMQSLRVSMPDTCVGTLALAYDHPRMQNKRLTDWQRRADPNQILIRS